MKFKILNPCHRTWASLEGTGNERYCDDCKLGVHDLSQLTDHCSRCALDQRQTCCTEG